MKIKDVFLICIFFNFFFGKEENTKNDFVFLKILNDVRKNPDEYRKYLDGKLTNYLKSVIRTNKEAITELNNFLITTNISKEIKMNPGLQKAAIEHSEFNYKNKKLQHLQENYLSPRERVKEYGNLKDPSYIYQIVGKFSVDLGNMLKIVLLLLLENEKSVRKNKNLLLSKNLEDIGIGILFKKRNFFVTILIAEDFECTIKECIDKEINN